MSRKRYVPVRTDDDRLSEVEAVLAAHDAVASRVRCCAKCTRGGKAFNGGCGDVACRCHRRSGAVRAVDARTA